MVVGFNRAKSLRRARNRSDRAKLAGKFERMRKPKDYKSFVKYLWALANCQTRGVDPGGGGNDIGCGEELGVMRTIQTVEEYRHLFKGERPLKKKKRKMTPEEPR